jgi:hypothetical protein
MYDHALQTRLRLPRNKRHAGFRRAERVMGLLLLRTRLC